ncbi:gamma-glutamyltransferase [Paenibacillus beijingensis]|uniref:Glutathione hydrolase proenzyme n=1 Tax=Paenibacillus beijingensis TaxID=1126833 RepID=A0A0D5NJZ7_9BACL|nr:gamma-glutamyltransferase [Paenibacillus beijingensis]AJY75591.1 gamma-glutamyltranspeptidase [Paenibacillus beijingensis]
MQNIMPTGLHAMVTSPHYLASHVGSLILKRGGSAFDAAVAVSAALGVVYPHMTGLGGDAFFMLYDAKEGTLHGYNGSGRSGRQLRPEIYTSAGETAIPLRGIRSAITVPGMVDTWWEVWRRGGKLPWEELLEPAAEYAEKGFPISRNLHYWMIKNETDLRACAPLESIYFADGKLLSEGDRLLQPDLARALRELQTGGRDAFYKGSIMKRIIAGMQADGGLLTEEDFTTHSGEWVKPVSVTYRGYEIHQMPPNSQGFTALMMMNILENEDLSQIPRNSAAFYHLIVETVKKAFRDRDRYLTDPDFAHIPLERLLSKSYAKHLYDEIDQQFPRPASFLSSAMGQDTAYAAVTDEEGNAVSFIQSLYFDFGSAYSPGDSGIIMQNRGSFFSLNTSDPNVLAPGKRSFHTLMPGMITRGGKPYALVGTQGGEGQPQTTLSVLTGLLDYGCTIQEALALPRWVYGRTWGEDSDAIKLENRDMLDIAAQLREWGHEVELVGAWDGIMGQSQGIVIGENGVISGAADPRGDGMAIGW